MTKYVIKGKDRFYQVDTYGSFDNLKDCLNYLDRLKRSCIGETVKLWYEEKGEN